MGIIINNSSERLFAELCGKNYLKGFVFHSPKYGINLGGEAGDVVLWIRNQIVVFEIMWRNVAKAKNESTKNYLRKIREKRKQLENDFNVFSTTPEQLKLTNEIGEIVEFTRQNFHRKNFSGVILLDIEKSTEQINYLSYRRTLESNFPISIFTKSDFLFLTTEADTIPDLTYYFKDRYNFLKTIFDYDYELFLNINRGIEKDLMAFYKMNEYQFPLEEWNKSKEKNFGELYETTFAEKIKQRDKENKDSYIVDEIIDELRNNNEINNSTLLHSSELAIFTRRARAEILAKKISYAFEKMQNGKGLRYWGIYNQTTECWLLFYFQYGGDSDKFNQSVLRYCRLKLFYEMNWNNFKYSVFGYGFRKSTIETGNTFDQVFLCIEDPFNYRELDIEELKEANKLFGNIKQKEIKEFPE
ncbi:MAG: hypothetical protein NTX65_12490 [Ignavibacteriales bacterium]|nr:hypothetical protein [Ignavibacteriales bacterium]